MTSTTTPTRPSTPKPLAAWHEVVRTGDLAPFEAVLAEDAVFQSPALHAPQKGKAMVALYLRGAMMVLGNPTFHYVEEWVGPRSAVLEFETTLEGLVVNGVDILHWDEEDRVTNFRVMVRPYKALTALMAAMAKLLEAAKTGG
ncbi:MAG: nuclear transport factor 2 family protein [Polyangiaceae bacterium]